MTSLRWSIEQFDSKAHDRSGFDCGAPELDLYLRSQASQDVRRDVARIFVACDPGSSVVAGFYSLSATSFRREDLPEALSKKLPHYPVPAALLGRLAVDRNVAGKGLGAHFLMHAFERVAYASRTIAVQAVIVDARDEAAASLYRHYGFLPLSSETRRLFLPLATLRRLVATG